MRRLFYLFLLLLPAVSFAQIAISGRVLNKADHKPVANASVFLSNSTIGAKTAADGTFTLHQVNAGKYELVISMIGFDGYIAPVITGNTSIQLADILLSPRAISLNEVVIKPDNNRDRNLQWFKEQFLGTSDRAKECKILNPEIIDLDYNEGTYTLTAATSDFLEIENDALGYKIKYLLTNFSFTNKDFVADHIYYKGSVLFEEMKGTAEQQQQWKSRREEVYENSEMHFLRAAIGNRLQEEGFSVQLLSVIANPERPADDLVNAKINYFSKLKQSADRRGDSLAYWQKKGKLPKSFQKLIHIPLGPQDILSKTDEPGLFALGCDYDGIYVNYNTNGRFNAAGNLAYVNTPRNTENTLISFNSPYIFFYSNGVIANPYGAVFYGVWGRNRVAELLPVNYNLVPRNENVKAPADSTVAKKINAGLKNYMAGHNVEKAYLHFDKPYYAAGDTIYFKAYVTAGDSNKLSGLSGVLHADLINSSNKISQSLKLQLTDGLAWGDFALPDTLPKGNYRVRAYTRLMVDAGDDNYFGQTIPIGSLNPGRVSESIVSSPRPVKPDMQFFPEGGMLAEGLNQKVAFKAVGPNGLGINVMGEVLDNENKQLATFASAHLGMGYFTLNPVSGKTYRARITYENGSQDEINLPMAASGVVLSAGLNATNEFSVAIKASGDYFQANKGKDFTMVISSAGVYTTVICKLDSAAINLSVLKNSLHTGIASFTLFSPGGEALAERLVFVNNNDQLNVNVSGDKAAYAPREKVDLKFKITNADAAPATGHFSVAVVNEEVVPEDENAAPTILTNLLLTDNLKGYIEQPNYYFTNAGAKTNADLDLVMLTHGYRRFEWKKLLNNEYPPLTGQPEKGLEISGTASTPNGKPLVNGSVSLLSLNGGPLLTQVLDGTGAFHFDNLTFMDPGHFVLKAVNSKLNRNNTIIYNAYHPIPATDNKIPGLEDDVNKLMPAYLENKGAQQAEVTKYGPLNGIALKEISIKTAKRDDDYPSSNLGGPGHADQVVHRKDFQGAGMFSDYFMGRLIGVTFRGMEGSRMPYLDIPVTLYSRDASGNPPMLLVVDGVKITDMSPDEINVQDIETVEVLRNTSAAIYGALGGGGVLVITTRTGNDDSGDRNPVPGILPISPKGFYKARRFYAPKYDHKDNNFIRRDLRSTIYWMPELLTDKDGNASLTYYNADGAGSYKVIIEGIDENGNLGRQVFRYAVR